MITKAALPALLSVLALSLGCSVFTGPADFAHAVACTAGATYVAGPNAYESASTGRVVIGSVDADSTIHGSVNLSFNSRRVLDMFHADWIHRGMLCG